MPEYSRPSSKCYTGFSKVITINLLYCLNFNNDPKSIQVSSRKQKSNK